MGGGTGKGIPGKEGVFHLCEAMSHILLSEMEKKEIL